MRTRQQTRELREGSLKHRKTQQQQDEDDFSSSTDGDDEDEGRDVDTGHDHGDREDVHAVSREGEPFLLPGLTSYTLIT